MKQRKKKLISLTLSLAVAATLAACGGGSNSRDIVNVISEETSDVDENADEAAAEKADSDSFRVAYDDEEIYMTAVGEFYELYEQALEADTLSERYVQMAIAEAKLLESGVGFPLYTSGAAYEMSRLAYRTGGYALWSGEQVDYTQSLITNEIIRVEDYAHLKELWNELVGTGTYTERAKAYLEEQGYTFADTYTNTFDELGSTWDILASGLSVDVKWIDPTIDYLYVYNSEGSLDPRLATGYEVSDDGLTYTFHIREGVIWTDSQGRKTADLIADDWVAAAQHIADTDSSLAEPLSSFIAGMAEYVNGETTDFSTVGVKAIDDYTLQYTLTGECPYFMSMIPSTSFLPMSRGYYLSQGGVFGRSEYEAASASATYLYGTDQDHIAYCGPYLCTNVTDKNSATYVANEEYWNAENITVRNLSWTYDDGSDTTRAYTNFLNGLTTTLVLKTAQLETAKTDGYFDDYAFICDAGVNTFMLWSNLHRQAYANSADGAVASTKTDEEKETAYAALQNQHFRLALAYSVDRATYIAQSLGEDLKYACLRNSCIMGTFAALDEDVTVDINGESVTFEAGTFYGEIVQKQLTADGYPMKVWDEETLSSDGYDGWYNPEAAAAELALAIEELSSIGIEVTEESPIILDYPYASYNETAANQGYVLKTSMENALGGLVQINLIDCNDATEYRNVWFNTQSAAEYNYDLGLSGGVSPDYGDPQGLLDYLLPYGDGYITEYFGLW